MTTHWNSSALPASRPDIALWRLNLLRGGYLLIAAGMGAQLYAAYAAPHPSWTLSHGVMNTMLLALVLLCLLGLRYPLKMLPLLFWEVTWKALWLATVALPLWRSGPLNEDFAQTAFACSLSVVFLFVVPWDQVWRNYVAAPAERLR